MAMQSEPVVEVTETEFNEIVNNGHKLVVVDFFAEWCMPCRMLAPTIDEIASEFDGKVKVGKLDTDSNRDVSVKYGITAIPTVLLFKNGEIAKKFVGITKKGDFAAALSEFAD